MLDFAGNADGSRTISLLDLLPLPEEEGHSPNNCEYEGGYTNTDAGFGTSGEARGGFSLRGACGEG